MRLCRALVATSVWDACIDASQIYVAAIDPAYMNGTQLCEQYDCGKHVGANCIVVRGKTNGVYTHAALLVPVGSRTDLKHVALMLDVKKVSFAPLEEVTETTGMEYGSITPVGLPLSYRILIDSSLMEQESLLVGGGKKVSKLLVPATFLQQLPNVEIVNNLALKT